MILRIIVAAAVIVVILVLLILATQRQMTKAANDVFTRDRDPK